MRDPLNDMSVEEYDKMFPKKKLLSLEQVRELRERAKPTATASQEYIIEELVNTLEAALAVVEAAKAYREYHRIKAGSLDRPFGEVKRLDESLIPFTAKTGEA